MGAEDGVRAASSESAETGPPDNGRESAERRLIKVLSKRAWAVILAPFLLAAVAAIGTRVADSLLDWEYRVEVELNVDSIQSQVVQGGGEYLIDMPVGEVGPPPIDSNTCNGRYQWAHDLGGIDVTTTVVRASLTAQEGHNVQLIGARRVPVGTRKEPAVGSVLSCPGRGGEFVRYLDLNLDTDRATYLDGETGQPREVNLPVEGGTTEVLDVIAQTTEADWSYRIELVLVVDGERKVEVIDDGGAPLRTTAPTNARSYQWIDGHWQDVTLGASPPVPDFPAGLPSACLLVPLNDASAAMGVDLEFQADFPPSGSWGASGNPVTTAFCSLATPTGESVQVTLLRARSDEEAVEEFQAQLALIDTDGSARDLDAGDTTKLVEGDEFGDRVLARSGPDIVGIYIDRVDGDDSSVDRLTGLLEIALPRLQLR